MFTDKIIEKITDEVEQRIIKQLEQLTFTIDVKVSRGDKDEENGIPHRNEKV